MVFRGEHDRRRDQASLGPDWVPRLCALPPIDSEYLGSVVARRDAEHSTTRPHITIEKGGLSMRLVSWFLYGSERRAGVLRAESS